MNKARHVVGAIALFCLIIGIVGIGVGFFMGSSPVAIQNHGSLTEYLARLETNWNILLGHIRELTAVFGFTF